MSRKKRSKLFSAKNLKNLAIWVGILVGVATCIKILIYDPWKDHAFTIPEATRDTKIATENATLLQPIFEVRIYVFESPTLQSDNDLKTLSSANISARILSTTYQRLWADQSNSDPNARYVFLLLINRGKEKANSVTFHDIKWTPPENTPNGALDFNYQQESLDINCAYALLVDAVDNLTTNDLIDQFKNIASGNFVYGTHFKDICVIFSYTNLLGVSSNYVGLSCVSEVVGLPIYILPP